jgi:hypothetical protein
MDYFLNAEFGRIRFSPVGLLMAAQDFLSFSESYSPGRSSIAPYFLCCRAIELALKAAHLDTLTQEEVKARFGHDLKASYDGLPAMRRKLSQDEVALLEHASQLYKAKAFEYVNPANASTAYSLFPPLNDLTKLARKLTKG